MGENARTDLRPNERARKSDELANDYGLEDTVHNIQSISD